MYKRSIVIVYYNYHKNIFKKYSSSDEAFHEDYLNEELDDATDDAIIWCMDNDVLDEDEGLGYPLIKATLMEHQCYTKEGDGELLYIDISM